MRRLGKLFDTGGSVGNQVSLLSVWLPCQFISESIFDRTTGLKQTQAGTHAGGVDRPGQTLCKLVVKQVFVDRTAAMKKDLILHVSTCVVGLSVRAPTQPRPRPGFRVCAMQLTQRRSIVHPLNFARSSVPTLAAITHGNTCVTAGTTVLHMVYPVSVLLHIYRGLGQQRCKPGQQQASLDSDTDPT